MVSVDVKHHVYLFAQPILAEFGGKVPESELRSVLYKELPFSGIPSIVQELCESRGGRPGLLVLTSLLVSVDVKIY